MELNSRSRKASQGDQSQRRPPSSAGRLCSFFSAEFKGDGALHAKERRCRSSLIVESSDDLSSEGAVEVAAIGLYRHRPSQGEGAALKRHARDGRLQLNAPYTSIFEFKMDALFIAKASAPLQSRETSGV